MSTNINTIIHELQEKVKAFPFFFSPQAVYYDEDGGRHEYISPISILINYKKLKTLLAPTHPFFAGLEGKLIGFKKRYCENDNATLYYPVLDYIFTPKNNPYLLSVRASSSALKSRRSLIAVLQAYHLLRGTTKLITPVFTFPKEISCALSDHPDGVRLAWEAWKKFYKNFALFFTGDRSFTFGARVNLHLWSTEYPLQSHWHFHCLAVNQMATRCSDGSYAFNTTQFALSPEQLKELKQLWTKHVIALAGKIGVVVDLDGKDKLAVVHYKWCSASERGKTIHAFKYANRPYLEDFANFCEQSPSNDAVPCELFMIYTNRARVYGWFRWFNLLLQAKQVVLDKELVPCPICSHVLQEDEQKELARSPPLTVVYRDWCKDSKIYLFRPINIQQISKWLTY